MVGTKGIIVLQRLSQLQKNINGTSKNSIFNLNPSALRKKQSTGLVLPFQGRLGITASLERGGARSAGGVLTNYEF